MIGFGPHYRRGYEDFKNGITLYNAYYQRLFGNDLGQQLYESGRLDAAEEMNKEQTDA